MPNTRDGSFQIPFQPPDIAYPKTIIPFPTVFKDPGAICARHLSRCEIRS
jgi:hypothetical protein